jgi:hypothetical protein
MLETIVFEHDLIRIQYEIKNLGQSMVLLFEAQVLKHVETFFLHLIRPELR